jgi:hypothetical protein
MAEFFDKYLTPISVGFPPVEVLATGGLALSIVDERKDSAVIASKHVHSERSEESLAGLRFFAQNDSTRVS